jgi:hypothetical protein
MFAREKSIMHVLESFPLDMCIDLGRGDGRMSEHGLDGPEIGAPLEQMRGERMPQHMW